MHSITTPADPKLQYLRNVTETLESASRKAERIHNATVALEAADAPMPALPAWDRWISSLRDASQRNGSELKESLAAIEHIAVPEIRQAALDAAIQYIKPVLRDLSVQAASYQRLHADMSHSLQSLYDKFPEQAEKMKDAITQFESKSAGDGAEIAKKFKPLLDEANKLSRGAIALA